MSMALASALQAGSRATTPVPSSAGARPLACPASPLVLAAVAGAVLALVLFSLVTLSVPDQMICVLVVQLGWSGNVRLLARSRGLAMLVAPLARVCVP
jgi:hypothetical protein